MSLRSLFVKQVFRKCDTSNSYYILDIKEKVPVIYEIVAIY